VVERIRDDGTVTSLRTKEVPVGVEDSLIRAAINSPHDDGPRLAYADWLEERGDPRGEFLRLQRELSRLATTGKRYKELALRERVLLLVLNDSWVEQMRRYTTPPPSVDVARYLPEVAPFARTAVRLHPHPMRGSRDPADGKIGGLFLWPEDEPWPMCPEREVPYVPVLQLRPCDVPEIRFPPGRDLLQLLWTPYRDEETYAPRPLLLWRTISEVTNPRTAIPDPAAFGLDLGDWNIRENIPTPCSVYPERVTEYPDPDELYEFLGEQRHKEVLVKIEAMERRTRRRYFYELSTCPGTKAADGRSFGPDGRRFEHLVTFASWEFDAGSDRRWVPLEDRPERGGPHFQRIMEPTGMAFGRTQRLEVWVCRDVEPWAVHTNIAL
jgi:uncharacterized protein (TIGR02996 family)